MSKEHTAIVGFFHRKDRFADFFNGCLFKGEQVIIPDELEVVKGESDLLIEDKDKNIKEVHRYRDIIMRWNHDLYLVIFACELQSMVHYAMPIRKMLYDSLSYLDQAKNIWESHPHGPKEQISWAEYLSRFRKEDKLIPVITVVFYYGMEEWDGSRDLYGMFSEEEYLQKEIIQKYVNNYRINLINVGKIEENSLFQTDLCEIFGLMKCRQDVQALEKYINEHKDYFKNVDGETYHAIGAMLHSKKLLDNMPEPGEKEDGYNMCKALEDLFERGRTEGETLKLLSIIRKKQEKGYSVEQIADALEEEVEVIKVLMKQKMIS